jgi:hypothetical protein
MLRALLYRISALVPGLGQLHRGRPLRAIFFFAGTVAPLGLIAVLYWTHMRDPVITAFGQVDEHLKRLSVLRLRYLLASLPSVALWACSIIDSLSAAGRHTATEHRRMGILQG